MGIARHWRLRKQRYGLVGDVCQYCNRKLFPPRGMCPECGRSAATPFLFSGRGVAFSFGTIYQALADHQEQPPYVAVWGRLAEGSLATAQWTHVGESQVKIGMPVEMATRDRQSNGDQGRIDYSYEFQPAGPHQDSP